MSDDQPGSTAQPKPRRFQSVRRLLFFSACCIYLFTANLGLSGPNPTGRFVLMNAIYERGVTWFPVEQVESFRLSPDFARLGDQFYTDKAPGVSLLLLPVFFSGRLIHESLGWGEEADPFAGNQFTLLLLLATVIAIAAWGSVRLYDIACRIGASSRLALLIACLMAFGSNFWAYAPTLFPHALVTTLLIEGCWWLLVARADSTRIAPVMVAGLLFGYASVVEYPVVFVIPAAVLYLFTTLPASVRILRIAVFAALAFVGMLPFFAYNIFSFGGPLRIAYDYSHWNRRVHFYNPIHEGMWVLLFSHARGILNFTPVLAFSVLGFFLGRDRARSEMWLFGSIAAIFLFFYAKNFDPAGGLGFGSRYILPITPFLLLPLVRANDLLGRLGMRIALGLAALAAIAFNFLGLWATHAGPALPVTDAHPIFEVCLPRFLDFLQGDMQYFRSALFRVDPVASLLVLGLGLFAIAMAIRIAKRKGEAACVDSADTVEPEAVEPWQLQALYLPAFVVVFYLGLAPRMSRGYEATQLREGSSPPGLFERFLEQPSDLVGITVALAALIVLGISGLRARSESSTQG